MVPMHNSLLVLCITYYIFRTPLAANFFSLFLGSIWFQRNLLCWKNVMTQPAKIVPFVDTFLQDWREAIIVFQRVQGVSFGHPPRLLYWLTPPPDCFKCNVDAAISSGWNVIVLAAIIHGDQGQFIKGHAIVLRSVLTCFG
ncbi:hypothetical protein Gohar_005754 [Gossypium harknessii]|uniref:Uncharacterized protein n=1 Tax=Gossypium harknessii TaxID=34285 RepID=A0A7J9H8Y0_9ROSI|nr:hypothetical protein [Gossypium harknessii]